MRMKKPGILFVSSEEMQPFFNEIKALMMELHIAIKMLEIEFVNQGYTPFEAEQKAKNECMRIKQEVVKEDAY